MINKSFGEVDPVAAGEEETPAGKIEAVTYGGSQGGQGTEEQQVTSHVEDTPTSAPNEL